MTITTLRTKKYKKISDSAHGKSGRSSRCLLAALWPAVAKKYNFRGSILVFQTHIYEDLRGVYFCHFCHNFQTFLLLVSHRTHLTIVHSDLKDNLHQCTHLGHSKSFHSVCLVVCHGVSRCLFCQSFRSWPAKSKLYDVHGELPAARD